MIPNTMCNIRKSFKPFFSKIIITSHLHLTTEMLSKRTGNSLLASNYLLVTEKNRHVFERVEKNVFRPIWPVFANHMKFPLQ